MNTFTLWFYLIPGVLCLVLSPKAIANWNESFPYMGNRVSYGDLIISLIVSVIPIVNLCWMLSLFTGIAEYFLLYSSIMNKYVYPTLSKKVFPTKQKTYKIHKSKLKYEGDGL